MAEAEGATGKRKQPEEADVKGKAPVSNKAAKVSAGASAVSDYSVDPQFIVSLAYTACDQLRVPNNTVFIAEKTDKIVDVFRGLIRHNFLSVPVLQKTGRKWYGFIDMADIVAFVVEVIGSATLQKTEDFWALFEKEERFRNKTVKDLMRWTVRKIGPGPVKTGYSLLHIIECLAREPELHRIAIVDQDRQLMNLITQSQVAKFLANNLNRLGNKFKKPLRLVRGVVKTVYQVNERQPAIDAFALMHAQRITGVAVVDDEGKLVGALSVRDLKAVAPDVALFWRLYQPTKTFLTKLKREFKEGRPTRPQYCTLDDSMETALVLIVEHCIHRVFIVDEMNKPIGIVSIKDILREFMTP